MAASVEVASGRAPPATKPRVAFRNIDELLSRKDARTVLSGKIVGTATPR
jgi:hypothetical protein